MDCSRIGDQHYAESDGANTEISNSRAFVGTGGKDEEAKDKTLRHIRFNCPPSPSPLPSGERGG